MNGAMSVLWLRISAFLSLCKCLWTYATMLSRSGTASRLNWFSGLGIVQKNSCQRDKIAAGGRNSHNIFITLVDVTLFYFK